MSFVASPREVYIRIAIYHGWELLGSGSNEYTRYLAKALIRAGDHVQLMCREEHPGKLDFVDAAYIWRADGSAERLFADRQPHGSGRCTVHVLPHGPVRPVFVTDKQRAGKVKAFVDLTDSELAHYRALNERVMDTILRSHPVDIIHANHMILQPTVAAEVGKRLGIPFIIYPHGSAIEYTVHRDPRFKDLAGEAIDRCAELIIGSEEVCARLVKLYPERAKKIRKKYRVIGVGVDTDLFDRVEKHRRLESIERVYRAGGYGGKRAAQEEELRHKLDNGDMDAVLDYKQAYAHELPDDSLKSKLQRIPWSNGKIALFVGALTVGKGVQSVVAGLPKVLLKEPSAHLVIIGSGAYREVLEALVHAISTGNHKLLVGLIDRGYDLEATHLSGRWEDVAAYMSVKKNLAQTLSAGPYFCDHVHFLGRLHHDLLRHIFPCADIAIFPSIVKEAYPLVLMESLSAGVLPAASDFSGFSEGLDHLVPFLGEALVDQLRLPVDEQNRIEGIEKRLSMLLMNRVDRAAKLRTIAVNHYDWKIRAAEMRQVYRAIIKDGEEPAA